MKIPSVGDKVKIKTVIGHNTALQKRIGQTAEVLEIESPTMFCVKFEDGDTFFVFPNEIE